MARIKSLSILAGQNDKDYLAEKYGPVIENIQSNTIYGEFKNDELSGDPDAGTVEAKRFTNSAVATYGTARAAGKGVGIKAAPVTVPINVDKEIIEEVEEKDTALYGVEGLIDRKVANHGKRIDAHLETAFWAEAANGGTEKDYEYTTKEKEAVMAAVLEMETLQNDFVDGVDRDLMGLVVTPSLYEKLHDDIDTMSIPNVNTGAKEFNVFHGVEIKKSHRLPEGVDYVLMVKGSIAQPARFTIQPVTKIEFSNAYGFGIFFSYGTKTVAPDLVFYGTVTEADPT